MCLWIRGLVGKDPTVESHRRVFHTIWFLSLPAAEQPSHLPLIPPRTVRPLRRPQHTPFFFPKGNRVHPGTKTHNNFISYNCGKCCAGKIQSALRFIIGRPNRDFSGLKNNLHLKGGLPKILKVGRSQSGEEGRSG